MIACARKVALSFERNTVELVFPPAKLISTEVSVQTKLRNLTYSVIYGFFVQISSTSLFDENLSHRDYSKMLQIFLCSHLCTRDRGHTHFSARNYDNLFA